VKILDFGISKIASISQKITGMAAVLGTPQYMSPEQAEGKIEQLDAASDQFSLAAIVYEMLTGRPAFSGNTLASVAYQVVHAAAAPIRQFRPELPDELDQVLARALAKNQKARFPSVSEFALHFRWTASLPVNEAQRRARVEAANAPTVEADAEETTAVSALPSGMAEVLRQTSGLSPRSEVPVVSATPPAPTGEAAQNEATVVSPSPFAANNEPTVVSMSMLAADDPSLVTRAPPAETILMVAQGRNRRLRPFAALAGLILLVGAAVALRGGARPTGETAGAPQPPSRVPGAPASLPTPMPVPEEPAPTHKTTASLHEPSGPAGAEAVLAPALGRAVAGSEATAAGKSLPRGRARAAAPLKATAPTGIDRTAAQTAGAECRLTIGSYPWSDLWIDGANTGQQTPVVGLPVTCGPHRLELKRKDLKVDQEENVTVLEGREFKREYELQGAALDE